jgi:cytoskeletal protein CcmA (bactofilin family)
MGFIDDLTANREWEAMKERVRLLETRTPLSDSAVSGGRTRFIGEDSFLIEGSGAVDGTLTIDGVEVVNGTLRITGTLNVSGHADFTGPVTVSGDLRIEGSTTFIGPLRVEGEQTYIGDSTREGDQTITGKTTQKGDLDIDGDTSVDGQLDVNGPLNIDGPTKITADLDITGDTKIGGDTHLSGDMTVEEGGSIKVDDMTIGRIPGTTQAGIDFGFGQLRSTGNRTVLQAGDAIVGVRSNEAALLFGELGFEVFSSGVYLQGVGGAPSGIQLFPVVADSNGKLYLAPSAN